MKRPAAPFRMTASRIAVLAAVLGLGACSGKDAPEYVERSVADIYNEAHDLLRSGEYQDAASGFADKVGRARC